MYIVIYKGENNNLMHARKKQLYKNSKNNSSPQRRRHRANISETRYNQLFKDSQSLDLYGGKIELSKPYLRRPNSTLKSKSDCIYKSTASVIQIEPSTNKRVSISPTIFIPKLMQKTGNLMSNIKNLIVDTLERNQYGTNNKEVALENHVKPYYRSLVNSRNQSPSPKKYRFSKKNNKSLHRIISEEVDKLVHTSKQ